MAVTFLEAASEATQGTEFYSTVQGTVATDAVVFNTGTRSLKFTSGAAAQDADVKTPAGVLADAGSRVSFFFRITDAPTTRVELALFQNSAESANIFAVGFTSAGKIRLGSGSGAELVLGTTTFSTGVWYRLTVSYTISSTSVNAFKIYVNGVIEINTTNKTLPTTGTSKLCLGSQGSQQGNSKVLNISDIYVDDSSDLGDPGDIRVTAKRPYGDGSVVGWTTQVGSSGSGYGGGHTPQINERPLSTTNGWSTASTSTTEEYSIESRSRGAVDVTGLEIVECMGWVYAKASTSVTGSIVVLGSSSNISMTTTNTMFTKAAGSTSYPGGGTDIGVISSSSAATSTLYEGGIHIAYKAGIPVSGDVTNAASGGWEQGVTIV